MPLVLVRIISTLPLLSPILRHASALLSFSLDVLVDFFLDLILI